ncbi:hypothetical protein M5X00_29325 [Paenibacillus alvei]|uniref:hypothetical protein n=1 Tax=Paenibacillus alvei TaxID=44250 RepID=UPI002280F80C|nr:hypothetical protein [Paenibacillus alvei]MCY9732157.1 hypothetical protein [Paenibacillus alvei]MCY9758321.1 hypothetical protein [Paenibacillus alvei]
MSRTTATIADSTKNELNKLKEQLRLKNDNDTLLFLMSLYKNINEIPRASFELLIELKK